MKPTTPPTWEHLLQRTITIRARRETVFAYFTDSARFAAWWGAGSQIDGRPGGKVRIQYPGGVVAVGEVLELDPGRRIVFTYGYEDPAKPIPPGGSRVTVTLSDHAQGTRLELRHEVADRKTGEAHLPGWWYQLALFANLVAREQHAAVATLADRFFALWNEPDEAARARTLEEIAVPQLWFRDAYACLEGRQELAIHISGIRQHMPDLTLARDGEPVQCQGSALVDWTARGPDGGPRGRGTNALELAPDGRLAGVTGFWRPLGDEAGT